MSCLIGTCKGKWLNGLGWWKTIKAWSDKEEEVRIIRRSASCRCFLENINAPLSNLEYQLRALDLWRGGFPVSRIVTHSVITGLLEGLGEVLWSMNGQSGLFHDLSLLLNVCWSNIKIQMEMNNTTDWSLENTIAPPEGFVASHGSFNRVKKASPAVSLLLSMPVIR